jgi:hypothetical protein
MKSFIQYLDESRKGTHHYVDIDDTLFHTTAKIGVKDQHGKIYKRLSNSEFNTHELPKGHSYDFAEFRDADKFSKESKPINPMISRVKKIADNIKKHPNSKVHLLTARADFDDREKFLDTFRKHGLNMNDIHVHRVGNVPGNDSPAKKKADLIRQHLQKFGNKKVVMYDDSKANLKALLNMKKEHPDVNFSAFHVGPHGEMTPHKDGDK